MCPYSLCRISPAAPWGIYLDLCPLACITCHSLPGAAYNFWVQNFQVAGSNVIHLQAVDFWNNNITQGGEVFVARWTPRDHPHDTVTASTSTLDNIAEGEFWADDGDGHDTVSTAAGFFFQVLDGTNNGDNVNNGNEDSNYGGDNGAYVADVGSGRYEITTASASGSYWLEIGVVEPGGLWGTYYRDGGVEAEGQRRESGGKHRLHFTSVVSLMRRLLSNRSGFEWR